MVKIEKEFESRSAAHSARIIRISAETERYFAAPFFDQCIDFFFLLKRLIGGPANGEGMFHPGMFHFAGTQRDDEIIASVFATLFEGNRLARSVDRENAVHSEGKAVPCGKFVQ